MAQQTINVGLIANDGSGDPIRNGAVKINENFADIYTKINNTLVPVQTNNAGKVLSTNGSQLVWVSREQPDWTATTGLTQILNKPVLAAVATTGSYISLLDKPVLPERTSQLINDADYATRSYLTWNNLSNKPAFSNVAFSGDYADLVGTPPGVGMGNTPPPGAAIGDLWYDSTGGRMYVYYDNAWVDSSPVVVETISLTTLQQVVAASTDFADFQSRVAAL
jgi:hypothetical protein